MSLPNTIIAGVNKAGTTSLFRYLGDHPEVCVSSKKEIEIFNHIQENSCDFNLEKYESYFSHCSESVKIRLEASPRYLYGGGEVAHLIKSHLENVRLIFILRDPIARMESAYFSRGDRGKKAGFGTLSTIDEFARKALNIIRSDAIDNNSAVNRRISAQIQMGCYVDNLEKYISCFGKDKICIVFFDEIASDLRRVMGNLCTHLDIDQSFYDDYEYTVENKTRQYRYQFLHAITLKLNSYFEPILNRFPQARKTIRHAYNILFEVRRERDTMQQETREVLNEFYRPWNKELAKLLNREYPELLLPSWLQQDAN